MRFEANIAPQGDRLSAAFEHSITWEDDLWRADPVDVEAIHAPARRKFTELLDAVTKERGSSVQARILLFHGRAALLRHRPEQLGELAARGGVDGLDIDGICPPEVVLPGDRVLERRRQTVHLRHDVGFEAH